LPAQSALALFVQPRAFVPGAFPFSAASFGFRERAEALDSSRAMVETSDFVGQELESGASDLRIIVNGEEREIPEGTTLSQLIQSLGLMPERVAIELNRAVVRRADWERIVLREGDRLEIVHFVGGG